MAKKLLLNDQLCFALYSATNSIIRYYSKYLSKLGITYTQYLVLIILSQEKKLTIQQISSKLKLNSSTISPVIKRLVGSNLIEKKRDIKDERIVRVNLSKEGLKIEEKLIKIQKLVVKKSNLSESHFRKFKSDLNILSASFDEDLVNNKSVITK